MAIVIKIFVTFDTVWLCYSREKDIMRYDICIDPPQVIFGSTDIFVVLDPGLLIFTTFDPCVVRIQAYFQVLSAPMSIITATSQNLVILETI